MIMSDKFSLHYTYPVVVLRCDICHARDFGAGGVFAWNDDEDMNLAALISRAQGHWAQIHAGETHSD